ncbi:hypothetical protein LCGC14_1582400 [marine sediment metagenome]|uniref:Uncharacterized protein n=1 Tax=marine sediment metagenome TaxID=412755 RepID=A0A0F9IGH3_9ZZZZ
MELSQMEHNVNEMWASLCDDIMMDDLVAILSLNPPGSSKLKLLRPSNVPLIKMCLNYVVAKTMYERAVARQLQHDHDEPPYTKNEQ